MTNDQRKRRAPWLTIIKPLRYLILMLRRLVVMIVLCALLPASAADVFMHFHDDSGEESQESPAFSAALLHTHVGDASPSDGTLAFRTCSSENHGKARFANLFRFVPAASFLPAMDLETVPFLKERDRSGSPIAELAPSAHGPPLLICSVPRSPPA
jgi:hypothetical protein